MDGQQSRSNVEFIKALCTPSTSQYVEVKVIEATEAHALWWAMHVQPEIEQDETRPDRTWDWIDLVRASHPLLKIARRLGQKPHPYCIVAADEMGKEIAVGMVLLVEPYPFLADNKHNAPFLWFLAAAPGTVLRRYLNGNRPMLMQALVDTGVVFSHRKEYQGRLGLHADAKGGDALARRYGECGLEVLAGPAKLPAARAFLAWAGSLFRRTSNGSIQGAYFYADTEHAEKILRISDHLRTYPPQL